MPLSYGQRNSAANIGAFQEAARGLTLSWLAFGASETQLKQLDDDKVAYMGLGASQQAYSQHEADLALVEHLLGRESSSALDAGTTTLLLWKCRRDPRLVAAAASWLERHSDAKNAFEGVELYLPQLAHMLVHLDVDWPAGTLERFALVVAQQSPHFALQLHWILRASMEDYAPRADGSGGNDVYYRRCSHLEEDVETVVAHGTARPRELEELYASGAIGADELGTRSRIESMSLAKRLVDTALRPMLRAVEGGTKVALVDPTFVPHRRPSYEGVLSWLRVSSREVRRARRHKSQCTSLCTCCGLTHSGAKWVSVWARIEGRSLLLYAGRAEHGRGRLVRALPLDGAHIYESSVESPANTFDIHVTPRQSGSFAPVRLRAPTEAARALWVRYLVAESTRVPRKPPPASSDMSGADDQPSPRRSEMEATSRRRYDLFEAERQFTEELVGVAETLRAMPRHLRQRELPRCLRTIAVPRLAYLPLCYSTDKWRTVLSVVAEEGAVFNTKERCPCLIYFETAYERGLEGLDVANVVHAYVAQNKVFETQSRYPDLNPSLFDNDQDEEVKSHGRNSPSNSFDTVDDLLPSRDKELYENPRAALPSPVKLEQPADTPTTPDEQQQKQPLGRSDSSTPRLRSAKGLTKAIASARKAVISIWRPERHEEPAARTEGVTVTPLRRELAQDGTVPDESPTSSRQQSSRNRISQQAERIHERASRVLDFWRDQLHSAVLDVGDSMRQRTDSMDQSPKSALRHGGQKALGRRASYGEGFRAKEAKLRTSSDAAKYEPGWALRAVIVKSNDDLRQEVFVVQLISRYSKLFLDDKLPLYLRPYRIVAVSASTGLVELVADSISLDKLFLKQDYAGSLKKHFVKVYGEEGTEDFEDARTNFIQSAAAAAFITYILAIKDRHNGNILLDARGHLIHIDFGFCLGHATGGKFSLERAPFKLTQQMIQLMGHTGFEQFTNAFADALIAARSIVEEVSTLIEIMQYKSRFPCFAAQRNKDVVRSFRARHFLRLSEDKLRAKARQLVRKSLDHSGTYLYDLFQYKTQGIAF